MSVPVARHRTKIVATIGPACPSPELVKRIIKIHTLS